LGQSFSEREEKIIKGRKNKGGREEDVQSLLLSFHITEMSLPFIRF
jgi:hypothetical protein